jgi:ubiquinone/menaquinone biosynthesis C-methylase UbiE
MNLRHARVTAWGLRYVSIKKSDTILDIGCSGDATIARLAAVALGGKVYGVDHSRDSVAVSRTRNRQLIAEGRAEVAQASVSNLPFADAVFDVATAVETHYYWPDLVANLQVLRSCSGPNVRNSGCPTKGCR